MADQPVVAVVTAEDDDPPGLADDLSGRAELRIARTRDEVLEALADAEILFVWGLKAPYFTEAWPKARRLRWIHTNTAGVDSVLTADVAESEVVLTNTKGVYDRPIAEWVLSVLLAFTKDLISTIELRRKKTWRYKESELLRGRRLLVVGAGSIGREIARLAEAAGLEVSGIARSERPDDPDFGRVAPSEELHALLPTADFVCIAAPLTPDTQGMFGPEEFKAMRPDARLLNVGRGPIVQEDALVDALRAGEIAGAALDVFETEPLPTDSPLWELPDVIVSPHCSGDYAGWRRATVELFCENLGRYERGEELLHVVDKQRAYTPKEER